MKEPGPDVYDMGLTWLPGALLCEDLTYYCWMSRDKSSALGLGYA